MVRVAGQTPTMDNREDLLDALNDFARKQPKEIPPLLEQYLKQVAKTGETLFPWSKLKELFVAKMEQVMQQFSDESGSDHIPPCPNVENARFEVYRQRIMEAIHKFHGAPFTVQRLCELLTEPKRHYKRCDKFMRGLEKNVLVVSTVDPYGKKVVSEGKVLVNGMDTNNSASPTSEDTPTTSSTPPVPVWNTSSPTTIWPLNIDGAANDVTTSSMLLEVSDTPGPCEASSVSIPTSVTHTSNGSTEGSSEGPPSGAETVRSTTVAVNGTDHCASSETAAVSVVEAGPDSSVQQVAAEEMVTGEEVAVPSTHEVVVDAVVHESVVETSAADPVEATEPGGEATEPTQEAAEPTDASLVPDNELQPNAQGQEAEAVSSGTSEKDAESECGTTTMASSSISNTACEESLSERPAPSDDGSSEAQAASSSDAAQAEDAETAQLRDTETAQTEATEAAESEAAEGSSTSGTREGSTDRGDQMDTVCQSSDVSGRNESDSTADNSLSSAVSSSLDVPAATTGTEPKSEQADGASDSSATSSSNKDKSEQSADTGDTVAMDADSANDNNCASATTDTDSSSSANAPLDERDAEDSSQPESNAVSHSGHEAMEQD